MYYDVKQGRYISNEEQKKMTAEEVKKEKRIIPKCKVCENYYWCKSESKTFSKNIECNDFILDDLTIDSLAYKNQVTSEEM